MKILSLILTSLMLSLTSPISLAETIRVVDLTTNRFQEISQIQFKNIVFEVKKGDQIPINFLALGDLIESSDQGPHLITIKKDFFFKIGQDSILFAHDGINFVSLKDFANGSLEVNMGQNQGGFSHRIDVVLKAFEKKIKDTQVTK